MKTLQILMPMGGLGSRFRDKGYELPKPLIDVNGQAMFLHALSSFKAYDGPKKYIFVVRKDAEQKFELGTKLKSLVPDSNIVYLEQDTRGAAETCLLARDVIDPKLPLIIMDCDFSFTSPDYFSKVEDMVGDQNVDGVLLSFESSLDRYSYAQVDDAGKVLETAEKKVISHNALAGAYSFSNGRLFIDAADRLMTRKIDDAMPEFYISLVYNILLSDKRHITLAKVRDFNSFGTPEELKKYLEETNND